jgi:hypothetical protein
LERAFARTKRKATERERRKKGNTNWNPHVKNRVLVESQNLSDAVAGVIVKFKRVYQGPYGISTILSHSAHEMVDDKGRLRGEFSRRQVKPYRSENDSYSYQA